MKKLAIVLVSILLVTALTGCRSGAQGLESNSGSTLPSISPSPTVAQLSTSQPSKQRANSGQCAALSEIRILPEPGSNDRDPVYESLMAKGRRIVPCLVEEIVNETPMRDPRSAPKWQHYKVGDTAVFLLVELAKDDELLEEMLPIEYREEWKSNGIYAYFNYVSKPENRRELQRWWRNWISNNNF